MGQKQNKKEKTEGTRGVGSITREQMEEWNQMTALRFQTKGGRHQKSAVFSSGQKTEEFKG